MPAFEPVANGDGDDAHAPDVPPLESKALARHPHVAAVESGRPGSPSDEISDPPLAHDPPAQQESVPALDRQQDGTVANRGFAVAGPRIPAAGGAWMSAGPRGQTGAPDDAAPWEAAARGQRARSEHIAALEGEIRRAGASLPKPGTGLVAECVAVPAVDGTPVLTCDEATDTVRDLWSGTPLAAALAQLSGLVGRAATLRLESAGDRFDLSIRYADNPAITRR